MSARRTSAVGCVFLLLVLSTVTYASDFLDEPTDDGEVEADLFADEPDDNDIDLDAPVAGRDVPNPPPSTETETDFLDTDEFDGIEEYKESVAKQQQQPGKASATKEGESASTDSPVSEPRSLLYELAASVFILLYIINYFLGKQSNDAIAENWMTQTYSLFESHFAVLGAYQGNDHDRPLVRDSCNQFRFYASGRRGCSGVLVTLNLVARHDLFQLVLSWLDLARNKDEMTMEVPINPDEMEDFVFAIAPRRDATRLLKEESDLRDFAEPVSCDRLPAQLALLTDIPDLQASFLDSKVVRILEQNVELVRLLHFTDQSKSTFFPPTSKTLTFRFQIPPRQGDMSGLTQLIQLGLYFIDAVGDVQFSAQNRKRSEKKRTAMRQQLKRAQHTQRQEEAQRKREERKQKEEDSKPLTKEAQKKREAREEKERLRRLRPKVKLMR